MARKQPRPAQLACFQRLASENTIINMPTGTGKTLVAVLGIDHFRSAGKVMFLVPTVPLVAQQAQYVRDNAAQQPIAVCELSGAKTDHLTASEWQDIVRKSDVLVGTVEVFRRALVDTKFLAVSEFSLIIFDECHNATGNSAMAGIMRDCVHRCSGRAPRILGLTASFVNGSLKGIEKKRKDLEGLLQSKIFCPDVDERPMEFERVTYVDTLATQTESLVEEKVNVLLSMAERSGVPLKEAKKVVKRGLHVVSELGMAAFIYFLRECVAPQVQSQIEQVSQVRGLPTQDLRTIPQLRQAMRDAADRLAQDGSLTALPNVTDKLTRLLSLVTELQREKRRGDGRDPRVIVFCEQTVLAYPLAYLLQEHTKIPTSACTGVGSMTDGQRKEALRRFKGGDVPMLTCTAALEEGLDVSECEFVVRFSKFHTTKSHVQGAGRARAWNARVFYFDNDPNMELGGASLMEQTAKAAELSLSPEELRESRAHKDIQGVHPYHTSSGAEISIFNCVQMIYEYAAKTMGASFRPEESMLTYRDEIVCNFPLQRRKTLTSVTVPTPDGLVEIGSDTVDRWWGDHDLDDVAERSRMKRWDGATKELRRFTFVVAVVLSKKGLLDGNNQPSARALRETRHACDAWTMSPGARIGVRYDPQGLNAAAPGCEPGLGAAGRGAGAAAASARGAALPSQGGPGCRGGAGGGADGGPRALGASEDGLCGREGGANAPAGRPAAASAGGGGAAAPGGASGDAAPGGPTAADQQATFNFKGCLNELAKGAVSYTTVKEGCGFRSTVALPDGSSFVGARAAGTKKGAEQHAAEAALRGLQAAPAAGAAAPDTAAALPAPPAAPAPSGELRPRVLGELRRGGPVALAELVRQCAVPKKDVNRVLYDLEAEGLARKVVESPPVWLAAA